jgi:preprotein translocase subunit Sec63
MGNKPPELYYDILHVARDASPQRVRAAYRSLVRQWHPDKHPPESRPAAEARFKAITEAYEVTHSHHTTPSKYIYIYVCSARVVAPTISCCVRARWC